MNKKSTESIVPYRKIGDSLKYEFDYEYDVENYTHRRIRAGNLFYKYDDNGNIICEQDGSFDSNDDDGTYHKIQEESDEVYSTDYGWGLFRDDGTDIKGKHIRYKRMYSWNEKNMLVFSEDASHSTSYIYGHDGQRTNKYTRSSETLYFNNMWTLHTDAGNNDYGGQYAKNVYLGETRIVTKLYLKNDPRVDAEEVQQYFYHSDHLGSASLISDYKGDEYQRIEYTPYGETWIERTDNKGVDYLPYKFTAKELDEETGLYYYGARYLDPRYSMWISTDPALGEYIPQAPINDEIRKNNQNLPGMGGIFNHINSNLYHYAGNNPIRYIDPDGRMPSVPYITFDDFKSILLRLDPWAKLMNLMNKASNGDEGAQVILNYVFHEASREVLSEISEKSGYVSLAFLAVGCPEGAGVFNGISMAADVILALDDWMQGNREQAVKNGFVIIAGLVTPEFLKKGVKTFSKSIKITIGSTGKYYEIGRKGAIKTEAALRKLLAKDIADGYFGQEVIPNAPDIIEQAVKVYNKMVGNENE